MSEGFPYPCCPDWARAFDGGTDGEGYGSLFHSIDYEMEREAPKVSAGCHETPIRFCPWCGERKKAE